MAKRFCLSPSCRLASFTTAQTLPSIPPASFTPLLRSDATPRRSASSTASSPAVSSSILSRVAPSTSAPSESQRERAVKEFTKAVRNDALAGVRRLYPRVIAATIMRTGDTVPLDDVIDRGTLSQAMRMLSRSCAQNNADYELLWRIFEDLQRVFLVRPTLDECACILAGMVSHGRLREAYEWLKAMAAVYRVVPTVREWNIVLAGIERHVRHSLDPTDGVASTSTVDRGTGQSDVALLQAVYTDMLESGVQPDLTSYNTLMTVFAAKGDVHQLRAGMDDMRHRGLAPNAQTHSIFLRGCMAVGDIEGARIASKALLDQPLTEEVDVDAWNSLLLVASLPPELAAPDSVEPDETEAIVDGGPEAVIQRMRLRGATPNVETLNAIIRANKTPLDSLASAAMLIDHAEELTGVDANAETVSIVVKRVLAGAPDLTAGGQAALSIYAEAVRGARAVIASNELVVPIIQALRMGQGNELDLAAVQGMYNDVRSAFEAGNGATPSLELYRELLQACSVSTPGAKWAVTLLADMRQFQQVLPMDVLTTLATPIMRVSPDYTEAYNVLVSFHNLAPKRIDPATADTLLRAYLDLPMVSEPAPLERVTELVQMFRMVDAHFGAEAYSALFRHYGGDNASGLALPKGILRFHTILSLDRRFDPTTPVLNDLIRAYANAGARRDAWRAWEAMLLSPQRALWDSGTITTVLDLCGSAAGASGNVVLDPRPVWKLARTREATDPTFQLPKRAWDAWVAALARIGSARQLDYATDVVVGQMGRAEAFREPLEGGELYSRARAPPVADAATVDTLLRYAHAKGGEELLTWLRERVRKHLPELWPDVAEVERFEWDEVYRLRGQHRWPDFGNEPWYEEGAEERWPARPTQVDRSM